MDKNNTLLLDIGNLLFLNHNDFEFDVCKEKNNIITQAMNQMGYDVLNLAPNDIFPDNSLLIDRCQKADFTIISANTRISGLCENNPIQPYIIKEVNGIRIGITGVMPMIEQTLMLDKNIHIEDPKTALNRIIPDLADQTDYIILLSGFNGQDTLNLQTEIPAIDLGLCVESTRLPLPVSKDGPEIDGSPSLMNITTKGMEVGIVNLEKKNDRVYITDADRILLDKNVKSDEETLKFHQQFQSWKFAKSKAETEEEKRRIEHEKLMKNLQLSPEEFFNQKNKLDTETEE